MPVYRAPGLVGAACRLAVARNGRGSTGPWITVDQGAASMSDVVSGPDGAHRACLHAFTAFVLILV